MEHVETDKPLLRSCLSGGAVAFGAFYDRFAPLLFSTIFAIVKHQKNAEDVLQEAFLQIWQTAATYDPKGCAVSTWSVMIARNKAIDRLRVFPGRTRALRVVSAREIVEALPDSSEGAGARPAERERVWLALSRMSATQRSAIDLAFFSGLTGSEISEKLDAQITTVRSHIRRGLLAVRDELAIL